MLDLSSRKVYGALEEQCVGGDAKADKVETAVAGNLAGLDSNGNLTDSGVSPTEEVTVEGNPVTFDSPFEQDAKSVVVSVKPIQAGSGTPSPENIRPISGIDEVEIPVTGKNKWGLVSGGTATSDFIVYMGELPTIIPSGNYTLSFNATIANAVAFSLYNANSERIAQIIINSGDVSGGRVVKSVSLSEDLVYASVYCNGAATLSNIQLELGTEATLYEPYNPNSHTTTIPLPSTLYGGEVDVTNGDADNRFGMVDLGSLSWIRTGSYFWCYVDGKKNGKINMISDCYKVVNKQYGELEFGEICGDNESSAITTFDPRYSSVSDFANAVTGLKLCCELATPTTISFDPADVELLEGTNVVSTNGEKVAIKYGRSLWQDINELKTDTEGKLDKSDVATIEGDTASKAYSVNEFMLRSDGLYKVTQPIAQNASITSSNTTKTTIGAVLTALLNS